LGWVKKQALEEELIMFFFRQEFCQDATAQMALLQFMHGKKQLLLFYNGTL
jgi:hypothetical protein